MKATLLPDVTDACMLGIRLDQRFALFQYPAFGVAGVAPNTASPAGFVTVTVAEAIVWLPEASVAE
jgi:hypothetical protein